VTWTPTAAGAVSLTAKATDNLGAATTSTAIGVTVTGGSGSGSVTLVGAAQAGDNASSSQLQITLPAGIQAGDQIIVGVTTNQGVTLPLPAGYTLVTDYVPTSSWHPRTAVYRHTATGAETTFTLATGWEGKAGVALVYRGVDAASPVAAFSTASADGTTVTDPSVTAPSAGSLLVMFAGATSHSTPAGFTAPSGMTERGEVNTLPWYATTAADQTVGAGATGTRTATFGGSGAALGSVLLVLKPA
jgi:hypothetical protein